jgi:hypothetical protein
MKKLKELLAVSIFMFAFATCIAQTENKDVTITASGSGATQEDAKQTALRSAIEQAYGAFISTKTEMLNDQVVADEMISVSAGNIKSYEILSQDSLPNGRWGLTLKALVSIDKLTSFVEAKGGTVEIKGGLFALNIKQQLLNEQGEIKAVAEMIGLLHEPMQTAFDYSIKSGTPQSKDAESKNWAIPLEVTATCNKNMDFCANYFIKTLSAIALTDAEFESYNALSKQVITISLRDAERTTKFRLRKLSSIAAIIEFVRNWRFYVSLFNAKTGINERFGLELSQENSFTGRKYWPYGSVTVHQLREDDESKTAYYYEDDFDIDIHFPKSGSVAGTYRWEEYLTLAQVEQISGFSVEPKGVISPFKHGGYLLFEENGHGLVASLFDYGKMNWEDAKLTCDKLIINGYDDWRLPNKEESALVGRLWQLTKVLYGENWGGNWPRWWTGEVKGADLDWYVDAKANDERTADLAWYMYYHLGIQKFSATLKKHSNHVRPVRTF